MVKIAFKKDGYTIEQTRGGNFQIYRNGYKIVLCTFLSEAIKDVLLELGEKQVNAEISYNRK